MTYGWVAQIVGDLERRVRDEMDELVVLTLSREQAAFVSPKVPAFGVEVLAKFPSASYEIDEAGKCLGYGRYTACVFHLMRTMEIALRSLGTCLGLPDPVGAGRNWGNMLNTISSATKSKAWTTSQDKDFLLKYMYR